MFLDPDDFILFFIDSVAHFLESRGMIEDAIEVATDPDYRFELAIQLGRLEVAKVSPIQWCH